MWCKMPQEFGTVVKDLSPNETDQSKKSLYVIHNMMTNNVILMQSLGIMDYSGHLMVPIQ